MNIPKRPIHWFYKNLFGGVILSDEEFNVLAKELGIKVYRYDYINGVAYTEKDINDKRRDD
jgi:hypothetical protein